jgi:hypothetical protein
MVMDIIAQIHACTPCEAPQCWFSCIASHSSLGLWLMSSLPKGESMGTKLVELFANWVVEWRNMINDYLRGELALRVLGGVDFRGSVEFELFVHFERCLEFDLFLFFWVSLTSSLPFCLVLPLSVLFASFYGFPSSRWPSWAFLSFLGLLVVLHGVLDSNIKLCSFVVNGLIKGESEKPSCSFLGLIVMSHWLGDVWIQIRDSFVLFLFYLCFI